MNGILRAALRKALILLGFVFALSAIIYPIAIAYASATRKVTEYSYFSEAFDALPGRSVNVTWLPGEKLDRDLASGDQASVAIAVTEAWEAHAAALSTGIADYLPDHFSGVALKRATESAQSALQDGAGMVVLHQTATPVFYHRDGSLMQLEITALTARFVVQANVLRAFQLSQDTNITTLTNETTGWHIYSHERRAADRLEARSPSLPNALLTGINYYPAQAQWTRFWPEFDRLAIAADFARIADLGANSVRVFLPRAAFLNEEHRAKNLENLAILLIEAEAARLRVVPTLFDLKGSFAPATWANDAIYLNAVLPVIAASPSVAFVDIKNEPDLNYEQFGRGIMQAWLKTMIGLTRRAAPGLAVTIGWSNSEAAADLIADVDLVTYHDYKDPGSTRARLEAVRAVSGEKPVMVTEIGASSWSLVAGFLPHSESGQAAALSERLQALAGADGIFVWTLHDFPDPDPIAIGRSPWVRGLQSHYGLFRPDGTAKPGAAIVKSAFTLFLNRSLN